MKKLVHLKDSIHQLMEEPIDSYHMEHIMN